MAALYALSSIPGAPPVASEDAAARLLGWVPPGLQNLMHVPVYALLGALWYRAFPGTGRGPRFVLAFAAATLYGLYDEWHQLAVPGRYASATDCVLNALGALLGAIACDRLLARLGGHSAEGEERARG